MRWVMRSKIHKAIVTEANVDYIGSITIDADLIERVDLWPGEKVLVVSNTSGARLETYVIAGERGSGIICMNGAAAHLIKVGEEIIIMGFELTDQLVTPKIDSGRSAQPIRAILISPDQSFIDRAEDAFTSGESVDSPRFWPIEQDAVESMRLVRGRR